MGFNSGFKGLRTSSSYTRLPVTSILSFIFPSITCIRRQILRKMWQIQLVFLLFIVCRIFIPSLILCNTSSYLTWSSNWSPSFCSTAFQNFPGISDLLSEVSKFQHHTKLCSKCNTLLDPSLNWNGRSYILDIHVSMHHDIIYENGQQDTTI